ncbi:MAG: hypothetical protein PHI63_02480 [Patescibacteria group bacterium]|nr:hypothetical protein [Patescibacteria group bacterium]
MTVQEEKREGLDDVGQLEDAVVVEVGSILAGQFPAHVHAKERTEDVGDVDDAITIGVAADEGILEWQDGDRYVVGANIIGRVADDLI